MKRKTFDLLVCPFCLDSLKLEVKEERKEEIWEGELICSCGKRYPISYGIPRFEVRKTKKARQTVATFGFEWLHYQAKLPEWDKETFLSETLIRPEELKGKLILDAGCGEGRYSRAAARLGAKVIALDASCSVERAKELNKGLNIDYLQADILRLPFKAQSFDFIFSLGVLHHTINPEEGVKNLSKILKREGFFSFWVYGRCGTLREFKPEVPEGLKKISILLWLVLKFREVNSNLLRKITIKLPSNFLHSLAYLAVPLGKLKLLNTLFPISTHSNPLVRINDTFDWYAPVLQSHHTKKEVSGWCENADLVIKKWFPYHIVPKFGVKTIRK